MTLDAQALADRYVALWNEPDPAARRAAIARLWLPEGVHHVGMRTVRGHDALEVRVTGSHDKNVRDAGHVFEAVKNAQALPGVITFNWEMVRPSTGEVLAVGLEFLQVDAAGCIASDFQFIVSQGL